METLLPEPAFRVCRLGVADTAPMRGMLDMFALAFEDTQNYTAQQPDDAYLAALLGDSRFFAVAAVADGRVIGGLTGYVLPKFEQARCELYIYDLAVVQAWRRRGVATALIGEVQHLAAELGAWVVFVQADHGDDPAIALYTGLGQREEVLHFDIAPKPR
jgi:aminoglycoside 3-N-acetyltransferase I